MININSNSKSVRRVPINRNRLFYDTESFAVEKEIGKNYIEQDMGQTVVLYQVDASKTQSDDVYGETKGNGVKYKTPVEIPCVYKIEEPELKSYDKDKNLGTYMKPGKITIGVYPDTLKELGVEAKKGDYIMVQVTEEHSIYFVLNAINEGYANAHSLWGYRLWITWEGYNVDESEFSVN